MAVVARFGLRLVALLAALAGPPAFAQSGGARVESPSVRTGDTWMYNKLDGWTGALEDVSVNTVTKIDRNGIAMQSAGLDGSVVAQVQRTAAFNLARIEGAGFRQTAAPFYPNYSFPLYVGKTWSGKVVLNNSRQGDTEVVAELSGRAVRWEMVTVPAGNFLALRLEMKGTYASRSMHGTVAGTIEDTLWYAPEVRNAVRYEYKDFVGGSRYNHEVHELARFWPGP